MRLNRSGTISRALMIFMLNGIIYAMARQPIAVNPEVVEEEDEWQSSIKPQENEFSKYARVAAQFGAFRPAAEVLEMVKAVPTIFTQFDFATRVGGLPLQRFIAVHGPSSHGKAQPLDEPVFTPEGWKNIGSLEVGDRVIGSDGKPTIVTNVFPQGTLPIYEIVFDDGTFTRCCAEHLWMTTTDNERNAGRYSRGPRPERKRIKTGNIGHGSVKTTAEIAATIDQNHSIDFPKPFEGSPIHPNKVDPYCLGLLLGDGSFVNSSWTFTAEDNELHDAIYNETRRHFDWTVDVPGAQTRTSRIVAGDRGSKKIPSTRVMLSELDGKRSEDKYVPQEYLMATPAQRLSLLQGLMDTDGSVSNEGQQAQFSSSSEMLRDSVAFLARSLGGRALVYPHETPHLPSWCVMVSFDSDICPFRLKRKADLWKSRTRKLYKRIVAIKPAGKTECVCIKVAAEDSLYITKDFILTHNTSFCMGLEASFIKRKHFANHVDAEMTTPFSWALTMLGDCANTPLFNALRPKSYEETVESVRESLKAIIKAKKAGHIPDDTACITVVDSMRKLVPENILKKILKGDNGVDGMGGRAAQIKAAMNAAWLDELIPLLCEADSSMVVIVRESENSDKSGMFDQDWKMTGGKAIEYDSSLLVRIVRASYVMDKKEGGEVIGEKHLIAIRKTKVSAKDDKVVKAYFHTSNGKMFPEGFDKPRDVLELAKDFGIVNVKGSWLFHGQKRFQGELPMLHALHKNPGYLEELDQQCREDFKNQDPQTLENTAP